MLRMIFSTCPYYAQYMYGKWNDKNVFGETILRNVKECHGNNKRIRVVERKMGHNRNRNKDINYYII